jgi:DNA-binding NtrC family response regulator
MNTPKRIVLVQNDQYLIDTRKALLEQEGYKVEAVHTVASARAICQNLDCDLVIVDSEEDYNIALTLCEDIKTEQPDVNVAVITWHESSLESECPDEVIPRVRGPQVFLNKVRNALA